MLAAVLLVGAQDPSAAAPTQDAQDFQKAVSEGRFAEALSALDRLYPGDAGSQGDIALLKAAFLNRLGRHAEAQAVAEKAMKTDVTAAVAPNLQLELGIACYKQGNSETAIEHLSKAIDLGTPRSGEARTFLAAALAEKGDLQEAQDQFEKASSELSPDSPMYSSAREWRDHLHGLLTAPEEDRWGWRLNAGMGHASNALRINGDSPLPGNVSNRSTYFFQGQANFWVDAYRDDETRLRLSFDPQVRRYLDAGAFSYFELPFRALLTHEVDSDLTVGVGLAWQTTWLMDPGRKFQQTVEPTALLEYRWSDMTSTSLTVSRPMTNYYLSGLTGPLNPDSDAWRVRAEQVIYLTDEKDLAIIPSVGCTWNEASGSDWDYQAFDASIAGIWRPVDDLTISGGLYYAKYDYDHPSSLSAPPKERRDSVVVPFASINYRVNDYFGVAASFSHTDNASNIAVFDYANTEWSIMPYVDLGKVISSAFED